jgi:hypothetical protein
MTRDLNALHSSDKADSLGGGGLMPVPATISPQLKGLL